MTVIKIILWFIVIPFILGKSILKKDKEDEILYSWVLGNMIQMAVFFVLAIPMILNKVSFFVLWKVYIAIIIVLLIIVVKKYKERFFQIPKFEKISIFQIIFIIIIIAQLFIKVKYTNINNDDSSYIVTSTQMQSTGYMYYTEQYPELEARKALGPISAYYATVSEIVDVQVAILAHTVMPIFVICLAYLVYYYLGKKIFKNKDSLYIMLIILSFLNLYAFSNKGINRYLTLYSWFGRSILAGICLPLIWKISLEAMDKKGNHILDWIALFITVLASCMCSQMAVPLVSISIAVLAFISMIRDKKIAYLFKAGLCVIPCLIVGIIYILMK